MAEKKKPEEPAAQKKPRLRLPGWKKKEEPAVAAPPVEARAMARFVRLSPQKARLVIDLIRGREAGEALEILRFTKKRAAKDIEKVLRSAIANAEQKAETVDVDRLYVKQAFVNEGPRWKRMRPAPFGRGHQYQRRTAHIVVSVAERRVQPATA